MELPFGNLKVIELAGVLAGPSVGMFFAECGARVLKIENKLLGGDVTRSWKLATESKSTSVSAYFSAINYKKQYRFLDFTNPTEKEELINELKTADIVLVNFKQGDAAKFGLDYETLKGLNSKLIYGEISGFGEQSDRVAYDLILQAESGFMAMNGTSDSGPVKMPVALIDVLAGHQLKEGILIALLQRNETGKGCRVHVSLYDSAVSSLMNQASNWLMNGVNPARIGSKHPNIAPYGDLFYTADEHLITLAVGSDGQFSKLCQALHLEALIDQPAYATNQARVQNREQLAELLGEKIKQCRATELMNQLHALHVPAAQIKTLREVFMDKQAQALVREELIDDQLTRRVSSVAFRISE